MNTSLLVNSLKYISDYDKIKLLIQLSRWLYDVIFDLNTTNKDLSKTLTSCLYKYHFDVAKLLLLSEAIFYDVDQHLLLYPEIINDIDVLRSLINRKMIAPYNKSKIVSICCISGHTDAVELLFSQDIEHIDNNYQYLINACQYQYTKIVKLLLKHLTVYSDEALLISCNNADTEILNILLSTYQCKDNKILDNILITMVYLNKLESIKIILSGSNFKSEKLIQAIYICCNNSFYDIAKLLIENGVMLNSNMKRIIKKNNDKRMKQLISQ